MAQVPYQSFYLGPFAVYTSPTGMTDPITGVPYLGGSLHVGDYCDLTASEAAQWNKRFGSNLYPGRYRYVQLATAATAANTGFGKPVAWGKGTYLAQVVVSAAGSSATTDGTYTCTSSTSGGTAATALVTVSGGAITGAQLLYAGANFTSTPTFGLTEIAGLSGGSVLAELYASPNFVCTVDSGSVDLVNPRGVFLCSVTSAQVTATAYVVIQEEGIAPALVSTATNTALPLNLAIGTGGAITSTTANSTKPLGFIGYSLDIAAASTIVRVVLDIPVQQG